MYLCTVSALCVSTSCISLYSPHAFQLYHHMTFARTYDHVCIDLIQSHTLITCYLIHIKNYMMTRYMVLIQFSERSLQEQELSKPIELNRTKLLVDT